MRRAAQTSLASAAALLLAVTACSSGDGDESGIGFEDCEDNPVECNSGERIDGGELVWGLDSGWTGWTNAKVETYSLSQLTVIDPVAPGLMVFQPDGTEQLDTSVWAAEPELISEEPMQVQYELNPDANWGEGTSIGLDDFIWYWYAYSGDPEKCAECTAPSDAYGGNVEDIEETEDNTFVVTYVDGYTNPEWIYTNIVLHPAHVAEANGFEDWKDDPEVMADSVDYFAENPPLEYSAGPYRMVDAEEGDYAIYEPNEDWAGDTEVTLDRLEIQAFEDTDTIFTEIRQGNVHGAAPRHFDPNVVEQLQGTDGLRFNIAPGSSWEHITTNTRGSVLSDRELRRAVFTAIDVEGINERVYGTATDETGQKLNHLFPPEDQYFEDHISDTTQGSGDADAAREILEEAGYEWDDDGQLLDDDGEEIQISYRMSAENANQATKSELVQSYLEEIGITVSIDPFPSADLTTVLGEGEFDMAQFGWTANPLFSTIPNQQWHSASPSNYGGLENAELDEYIDSVQETFDMDEAAVRANDAASTVVDEAYVLPFIHNPALIIISDELVNVRDNWATPTRATYNVEEWGFVDPDTIEE